MSWICKSCTFENSKATATICDMCATRRRMESKTALTHHNHRIRATKQQTLLQVPLKKSDVIDLTTTTTNTVASSSSRKRKAPSSSKPAAITLHSFPLATLPKSTRFSSEQIQSTLATVFGIETLRPNLQSQAITNALQQQSQLLILATGGGKSLCYQLPACLLGGVTIVVSPLLALMQDQVHALLQQGIPAACVSSQQTAKENQQILQRVVIADTPKTTTTEKKNKPTPFSFTKPSKTLPPQQHGGPLTLLYITPESIQTDRMREVLDTLNQQKRLTMFAIDEAHCVSSWGHDFRPAYRRLTYLRTRYPQVPCLACTATATPHVVRDIQESLHLSTAPLLQGSFDRPNVFYKVKYKDLFGGATIRTVNDDDEDENDIHEKGDNRGSSTTTSSTTTARSALEDMVSWIVQQHAKAVAEGTNCSGIVYVHKREDTTHIANAIAHEAKRREQQQQQRNDTNTAKKSSSSISSIRAAPYHAGLSKGQRQQVLDDWSHSRIHVAVATVAFGMGIDLAHVRYVIHWTLPKTVEGFYQESGRAGRDGLPSHSILYYSSDDVSKFQYLIRMQSQNKNNKDTTNSDNDHCERKLKGLEQMVKYCTQAKCRRNALIQHFGGRPVDCQKTCDVCRNPAKLERTIQSAMVVREVLGSSLSRRGGGGGGFHNTTFHSQQPYWGKKNDDDEDDDAMFGGANDDWGDGMVGDLRVTDAAPSRYAFSSSANFSRKTMTTTLGGSSGGVGVGGGFVRASSILEKYEQLESRNNDPSSEDQFQRPSSSRGGGGVPIPEHFRKKVDVLATKAKKQEPPKKPTSSDHAQKADQLRRELEELNAERERRMKALLEKRKNRS